jgi:hypothetical protein
MGAGVPLQLGLLPQPPLGKVHGVWNAVKNSKEK